MDGIKYLSQGARTQEKISAIQVVVKQVVVKQVTVNQKANEGDLPDNNSSLIYKKVFQVANARGLVVCLHGAESHSEWFQPLVRALNWRRYDVLVYDRQGFGQSAGQRGHHGSGNSVINELTKTLALHTDPYESWHLLGMSWGGLLGLSGILARGLRPNSFIAIAPGIKPRLRPRLYSFVRNDLWSLGRFPKGLTSLMREKKATKPARRQNGVTLGMPASDFTFDSDIQRLIEDDPFKVEKVSFGFLRTTLELKKIIRNAVRTKRRLPIPTYLGLATEDPIIANRPTAKLFTQLCSRLEIGYFRTRHSIALDQPEALTTALETFWQANCETLTNNRDSS